jgi:protein phosphatase
MNLKNIIPAGNYSGIATFSDVHAHAKKLKKGIKYALKNNLFIVFLGDLVDGHDKPLETVLAVKQILDAGTGVLVIGNHDDKFYRYAKGNPVILKKQNKQTLADLPKGKEQLFLQTMIDLHTHKNSDFHFEYENWVFIHGACHEEVWQRPEKLSTKAKHRALYGEVNGEEDETGFPVRLYNWVDQIPAGQGVVVGHDRKPYGGKKLVDTGPLDHTNDQGGRAIFSDTGCGKGGKLTLTVFEFEGDGLEQVGYETL